MKVGNLGVERLDAGLRKLTGTAAVFTSIQIEEFPDLLERKPRCLRLPDEPQAAHVFPAVVPDPVPSRRRPEQALALVEPDRLDAYATGGGKLADGQRLASVRLTDRR